jgi:hypothetical protein
VGRYNARCCNHWVSKEALKEYVAHQVQETLNPALLPCPQCLAEPCEKCATHGKRCTTGLTLCCVPEVQVRSLLRPELTLRCGPQFTALQLVKCYCFVQTYFVRDELFIHLVRDGFLTRHTQDQRGRGSEYPVCCGAVEIFIYSECEASCSLDARDWNEVLCFDIFRTCLLVVSDWCRVARRGFEIYRQAHAGQTVKCPEPSCEYWCEVGMEFLSNEAQGDYDTFFENPEDRAASRSSHPVPQTHTNGRDMRWYQDDCGSDESSDNEYIHADPLSSGASTSQARPPLRQHYHRPAPHLAPGDIAAQGVHCFHTTIKDCILFCWQLQLLLNACAITTTLCMFVCRAASHGNGRTENVVWCLLH